MSDRQSLARRQQQTGRFTPVSWWWTNNIVTKGSLLQSIDDEGMQPAVIAKCQAGPSAQQWGKLELWVARSTKPSLMDITRLSGEGANSFEAKTFLGRRCAAG